MRSQYCSLLQGSNAVDKKTFCLSFRFREVVLSNVLRAKNEACPI